MKRTWSMICVLGLALTMAAAVMAETVSPILSADTKAVKMLDEPGMPGPERPAFVGGLNELDEILGDTVVVGNTWRDMQHNATMGRMIEVDNWADGATTLHFTYCYRATPDGTSMTYYISAARDAAGLITLDDAYTTVNSPSNFGGYQVINLETVSDTPIVTYHGGPPAGTDYFSFHATPNPWVPNMFTNFVIPAVEVVTMWPHAEAAEYDGNFYIHSLLNQYDPDNLLEDGLYYNRSLLDPASGAVTNATPGGLNQVLVTDIAMNLANSVATSPDGSNIALANTVGRFNLFGEGEESGQHNNDILIWNSTDGGDTWNFGTENAINITNFVPPNANALPDTTEANGDTMRVYTEIDMVYDDDNVLHVVFGIEGYDFYRGTITYTGRIYYWNSQDQLFVQVQDGTFWNFSYPAVWERIVGNAQLYYDNERDQMYCAWVQYGEPGDTLDGYVIDASDDGFKATDIFMSMSEDYGKHWAMPINVTNTRNEGNNLLPYQTESERELSFALNSDGDYIHLTYTVDYDPGIACPGGAAPEGDPTDNIVVYHSIAKQDLVDAFNANAEWIRNYPLHVDSSNHYEDPNDWVWDGPLGVKGSTNVLQPDEFELMQNYPNPFNPSTQISFTISQPGKVKLAVYDVLGREVATLVDRGMSAGSHTVNFYAGEMASGVYFYNLTSDDVTKTRKMVLLK